MTGYSFWFAFHLIFIFLGLAAFVLALLSAVMYLAQASQLKSKHPGSISLKLPSLDALDRLHFRSLTAGVILFSLGIASGLHRATDLKEAGQILHDPRVVLSFFTCLLYWIIFGFRLMAIRRGQKIALGTLLVFILLFMTVTSSYIAPSVFHRGL